MNCNEPHSPLCVERGSCKDLECQQNVTCSGGFVLVKSMFTKSGLIEGFHMKTSKLILFLAAILIQAASYGQNLLVNTNLTGGITLIPWSIHPQAQTRCHLACLISFGWDMKKPMV